MSRPDSDPSVDHEPQYGGESFKPDAAEAKAEHKLAREKSHSNPSVERAQHSVFDEPVGLPHHEPVLIKQDWYCRQCGYNLRGLFTGHPCPECGCVERYEPPREGEESYVNLVRAYDQGPSSVWHWPSLLGCGIVGVPSAFVLSFLLTEFATPVGFVVMGPLLAEAAKIIVAAMLVERSSRLIQRPAHLYAVTLTTAAVFAVVQNAMNLAWFYAGASPVLVAWRWTVCVAIHMLCTGLATVGIAKLWHQMRNDPRSRSLESAIRWVILAGGLHGTYNLLVMLLHYTGYGL